MSDLNIPDGLDVPKVREYETHRICGAPTTEHPDGLWHTVERTIADAAITELLGLVAARDRMLRLAAEDFASLAESESYEHGGSYKADITEYLADLRTRAKEGRE